MVSLCAAAWAEDPWAAIVIGAVVVSAVGRRAARAVHRGETGASLRERAPMRNVADQRVFTNRPP
jgi:uncharacterized protein YcbX